MEIKYFLLLSYFILANSSLVLYNNHEIWHLQVKESLRKELPPLLIKQFDIWSSSSNFIAIRVAPHQQLYLKTLIESFNVSYKVVVRNVQTILDEEHAWVNAAESRAFDLENYNTYEDIELYLTNLSSTNALVELNSLGKTVEGRDMWQVTISTDFSQTKPAVWVDCGTHAREWISPSTCLYGINYLSSNFGSNSSVADLLNKFDMYILPVANPDGYSYTFTDDRLYRKNRNKWPGDSCEGIDINRNFDDHWGLEGGSSNISCNFDYRGPFPSSENETLSIETAMTALLSRLSAVFTLHSYSQKWMYPNAWTSQLPSQVNDMNGIAAIGAEALESVHGTPYLYGSYYGLLYPSSGTTMDFAYSLGVIYSYTLELRPFSQTPNGFVLPPVEITPTGEETWAGIMAACMALP